MSVRVQERVWKGSAHAGSELLLLLAIADFADNDGWAYPSVSTLAAMCRTTSRYAIKLLEALTRSGELEVGKNQGPMGRGGRTNLYRIVLERLEGGGKAVHQGTPVQPPEAVNQSSRVQAAEAVTSGAVVNQGSGVNSGSRSGEPGCREVVHQSSPKPSENRQEPERGRAVRSATPLGSRIPPDWKPSAEDIDFCRQRRPDLDLDQVAETFRDHWSALSGKGATKLDWSATWRNWVRRERSSPGAAARPSVLSADEVFTGTGS